MVRLQGHLPCSYSTPRVTYSRVFFTMSTNSLMAEKTLHTNLHTTTTSQLDHNFYTTSSHQSTSHQFFFTPFYFIPSFFTPYYFLTLLLHSTCFFTPSQLRSIHYFKTYTSSQLLGFYVFKTSLLLCHNLKTFFYVLLQGFFYLTSF